MPTATTVGLSLAVGMALAATALTTGWLSLRYDLNQNILKWIILPTVGYGIALAINSFVQQISCGSIRIEQIALGNLPILGAILLFLLLTLFSAVRGPIEQAVDSSYRSKWGGIFAIAFYMFWAGMFGEAFAGGLAQSCGPQSSSSPLPK
jgi:hypothetical protein